MSTKQGKQVYCIEGVHGKYPEAEWTVKPMLELKPAFR